MILTFLFVFYLSLFCFECCDIVIMFILFCMTVLLHDISYLFLFVEESPTGGLMLQVSLCSTKIKYLRLCLSMSMSMTSSTQKSS